MTLKKSDLEAIYLELTIPEVLKRLGLRSPGALYRLLKKAGIDRKRPDIGPRQKTNIKLVD